MSSTYLDKIIGRTRGTHSSNEVECLVTFLNPFSYIVMRKHQYLLGDFDYIYIDGVFLCMLLRLAGIKVPRVSFDMTSMAKYVFEDCCANGKKIFLVGSKPGVPEKAAEVINIGYPDVAICGVECGYFDNDKHRCDVINKIVDVSPDYCVVGMGTPLQEKFLIDLRKAGWNGVGFTCGGFLHQTAGAGLNYYPRWINKLNLRWVYRMVDEPRLVRRYFVDYPKFLFIFLFDVVRYHIEKMKAYQSDRV